MPDCTDLSSDLFLLLNFNNNSKHFTLIVHIIAIYRLDTAKVAKTSAIFTLNKSIKFIPRIVLK